MHLSLLQRQLRTLLKARDPLECSHASCNAYLHMVSLSPRLLVVRESIMVCQAYDLLQHCPMTCRLLQEKGLFEEAVRLFHEHLSLSPHSEERGQSFLRIVSQHFDAPISSLARFEYSLNA